MACHSLRRPPKVVLERRSQSEIFGEAYIVHGLRETAALLDTRLGLLWDGRRTAQPRHRTLSAMLDWSYDLLTSLERAALRRLSIFVGSFTLDAAQAVAASNGFDGSQIIDAVMAQSIQADAVRGIRSIIPVIWWRAWSPMG